MCFTHFDFIQWKLQIQYRIPRNGSLLTEKCSSKILHSTFNLQWMFWFGVLKIKILLEKKYLMFWPLLTAVGRHFYKTSHYITIFVRLFFSLIILRLIFQLIPFDVCSLIAPPYHFLLYLLFHSHWVVKPV